MIQGINDASPNWGLFSGGIARHIAQQREDAKVMQMGAIAIFVLAAFCVWLTVRIVNRRERWAKWTLASVIGLPVLYVGSIGPVCWIASWTGIGTELLPSIYCPILSAVAAVQDPCKAMYMINDRALHARPSGVIYSFSSLFAKPHWHWHATSYSTARFAFDEDFKQLSVASVTRTPWRWEWTGPEVSD